ncbi:MAG: response regulator [Candidatus Acidiferrales bacterium]
MSAPSIFESFIAAQGYALFESVGEGEFRPLGPWPDWCRRILGAPPEDEQPVRLGDRSAFLENFLFDAAEFWRAPSADSIHSGSWVETAAAGEELPLEASAYSFAGRNVLLIRNLSQTFAQQQALYQTARDALLVHEKLLKEIQKKEILLHTIVHDLTQPLSAMTGVFHLLERQPLPSAMRKFVKAGERESQRQELMIRGILEAFSGDLAAQRARETTVSEAPDLLACAKQAVASFSPAFRERQIRLRVDSHVDGSRSWRVVGDSSRLDRIFGNLLENSMRYAPKSSTVTIGLEEQGAFVLAFVDDEGPGLPPDQRPDQLFALFAKGKSHAGKAGLGLYFCKITVERWGGAIGAETRASGGSRFWFRLPRATDSAAAPALAAPDKSAAEERPSRRKKAEKSLRILVADDAEINRDLVIELLKKRGHVAHGVADGREALAALERHTFDVLLLDEEMPHMTGLQTTAAIRQREAATGKHQIIVGISGHSTEDDEQRFRAAGMDASLPKPVDMTKLYQVVESAARGAQPAAQPSQQSSATPSSPAETRGLEMGSETAPQPASAPHLEINLSHAPAASPQSPPQSASPQTATSQTLADAAVESEDVATHLRRATGGNEKLVRSLAATFLADSPKVLARIRKAVAKSDPADLAKAAHLLKGSLAIFGAPQAVSAARTLEAQGRAADLRESANALSILESELTAIQNQLRVIQAEPKTKPKSKPQARAKSKPGPKHK